MTEQSPDTTRLFLTAPQPCPYLPGKHERKLFTHLGGRRAAALHALLANNGFRRSQNLIYRPACEACSACQSVRIVARAFKPSARWRRVTAQNGDLSIEVRPAHATSEQFTLFQRYIGDRHCGGGMAKMGLEDYKLMVEDTPVQTVLVEYRLATAANRPLIAVALSDVMPDGLSMVYSFFDPDQRPRGLGNFMILDHIRQVCLADLTYVYLGYWVPNSDKMAYKSRFRPLEVQRGSLGWRPLD